MAHARPGYLPAQVGQQGGHWTRPGSAGTASACRQVMEQQQQRQDSLERRASAPGENCTRPTCPHFSPQPSPSQLIMTPFLSPPHLESPSLHPILHSYPPCRPLTPSPPCPCQPAPTPPPTFPPAQHLCPPPIPLHLNFSLQAPCSFSSSPTPQETQGPLPVPPKLLCPNQ